MDTPNLHSPHVKICSGIPDRASRDERVRDTSDHMPPQLSVLCSFQVFQSRYLRFFYLLNLFRHPLSEAFNICQSLSKVRDTFRNFTEHRFPCFIIKPIYTDNRQTHLPFNASYKIHTNLLLISDSISTFMIHQQGKTYQKDHRLEF